MAQLELPPLHLDEIKSLPGLQIRKFTDTTVEYSYTPLDYRATRLTPFSLQENEGVRKGPKGEIEHFRIVLLTIDRLIAPPAPLAPDFQDYRHP